MTDHLDEIFESLKKLLLKFEKSFEEKKAKTNKPQYHLWTKNPVLISSWKKPKQLYFAGIITQKNHVGFYYMPVYSETKLKEFFEPELLSLLKGKSCFHIKRLTPQTKKQIQNALNLGYEQYKKRKLI